MPDPTADLIWQSAKLRLHPDFGEILKVMSDSFFVLTYSDPFRARYLGLVVDLAGDVSVKRIWLTEPSHAAFDSTASCRLCLASHLYGERSALILFAVMWSTFQHLRSPLVATNPRKEST